MKLNKPAWGKDMVDNFPSGGAAAWHKRQGRYRGRQKAGTASGPSHTPGAGTSVSGPFLLPFLSLIAFVCLACLTATFPLGRAFIGPARI